MRSGFLAQSILSHFFYLLNKNEIFESLNADFKNASFEAMIGSGKSSYGTIIIR